MQDEPTRLDDEDQGTSFPPSSPISSHTTNQEGREHISRPGTPPDHGGPQDATHSATRQKGASGGLLLTATGSLSTSSDSVPGPPATAGNTGCRVPPRSTAALHPTPSLQASSASQETATGRGVSTDLPTAWGDLLGRWSWDLFGSHTFREDVHPEAAFKIFRLFVSILNRKLYGPRWFKHGKGIVWVCAMERQARGVVHFHTLLKSPELVELMRSTWRPGERKGSLVNDVNGLWDALAGFARIEPIALEAAVRGYVAKYVLKGGEIELGGPGMPEVKRTGHPARVDRAWLTTEVGRGLARDILEAVTTPEERQVLMARFETPTRRDTADLLAEVRVRVLAYKAGHREPTA